MMYRYTNSMRASAIQVLGAMVRERRERLTWFSTVNMGISKGNRCDVVTRGTSDLARP
jgi:hypothetical protein